MNSPASNLRTTRIRGMGDMWYLADDDQHYGYFGTNGSNWFAHRFDSPHHYLRDFRTEAEAVAWLTEERNDR